MTTLHFPPYETFKAWHSKRPDLPEHVAWSAWREGWLAAIKAVEQSVQRTADPLCQVCLMPLSQHVHECVVPSTRRR